MINNTVNAFRYGWRTRRAWWFTASARTRERFARTTLGSFWLGLSNLLSISALATVYGTVFNVQNFSSYVVYLGTGLVIWNTIAGAAQSAPNLLRNNASNLKNTNIHPIFFSLEEWAFQVQTFFQSFGLVLLALSFFKSDLFLNLVRTGMVPLINLLLFIYWVPLVICLLGAKYEDVFQFIPIILQLGFLLSPILYVKDALGKHTWIAAFNPLYRVLSPLRHALIEGSPRVEQSFVLLAINAAGLLFSVWLLERQRSQLPFFV
jgi:lipopolysaccharide transport system permease protein